ncbi:hypothetical protein GLDPPO_GLDPPO_05460, partial [Dysosmobacter welbionis]
HGSHHRPDGQLRRKRGLLAAAAGGAPDGPSPLLHQLCPAGGERQQPPLYPGGVLPGGAAPHRGPAGSAQAGAGRNPGRHPLCGEHPLCGASGRAGPLPRPHLGAGGASGLLRQRVLRRVLPGDRLRHPGGQSHRRRRHRGSGSSLPAAAQQRHPG